MEISTIVFYFFATIAVLAALLVVTARSPVHSVLWLILCFFSSAGLFVLLGAEFLAMLVMIVYVGAVAVLFLFVVMMLDVDFSALKKGATKYVPFGIIIGLVFIFELSLIILKWKFSDNLSVNFAASTPSDVTNTIALSQIIYTDYIYLFQCAGLILLVAMIGAIVLTLRHKSYTKRQDVIMQMQRNKNDTIEIIDVKPGQGL